jgi:hypothetical protein
MVQCVTSDMHYWIMTTELAVWIDTEHPVECILAVDILPPFNASTNLTTLHCCRAQSPSTSCKSAQYPAAFQLWRRAIFRPPQLQWCWHAKCVCIAVHIHYLMVTYTSTCHMLSNICSPFQYFGHKIIVMTYRLIHACVCVCVYVCACVYPFCWSVGFEFDLNCMWVI